MESLVLLPTTSGKVNVTGEKQKGAGYTNFLGGSHTVAISLNNFSGRIYIQASLADNPADDDWFPVFLQSDMPFVQFPRDLFNPSGLYGGDTGTFAYTFVGNYVWLRAIVNRDYLTPTPINDSTVGSVSEILLNYGALSPGFIPKGPILGPTGPAGPPGSSVVRSFQTPFSQVDLDGDLFTVVHGLGQKLVLVQVYDLNYQQISPTGILLLDEMRCQLDLAAQTPISGVWHVLVSR
jgi:hypothetical protein